MSGAMRDHLARQITAGLDGLRVGNATSVSRLALIARGGTPCPGVFVPGEMRENSPGTKSAGQVIVGATILWVTR